VPEALPPPPATGRVFDWNSRVGLSDVAPDGRMRLDALARVLQDAAFGDVREAGIADEGTWVMRRCRIVAQRFPGFDEELRVRTWATGVGAAWAERRTLVEGVCGGRVEAIALWVHLDVATGHPLRLSPRVRAVYGEPATARRVSGRLRHPRPPEGLGGHPWVFRASDLDLAGHVNNAAYWETFEEELAGTPVGPGLDVEMEHREAAGVGGTRVLRDADRRWVTGEDGTLFASLLVLHCAPDS
jgi:acyl-ACP thioesterase